MTPEKLAETLLNQVPGSKEKGGASQDAGNEIAPVAADLQRKFARHFHDNFPRGFTADEIGACFRASPLSARPRISELHKAGLIKKTAERRRNRSTMTAAVWIATALLVGERAVAAAEGRPYQENLADTPPLAPLEHIDRGLA